MGHAHKDYEQLDHAIPYWKKARKAIDSGEFKAWDDPDKQAAALDRTVCTLMTGSSYIVHAEFTIQETEEWEAFIPDFLKEHCTAIYSGYGWLSQNPRKDVQRISKIYIKIFRKYNGKVFRIGRNNRIGVF